MENSGIWKAIFKYVRDAIVVTDQTGNIRMANPAAGEMFGYPPGELLDQNIGILLAANNNDDAAFLFSEQVKKLEGQTKDGLILPLQISVSDFIYARQNLQVCTFHDLKHEKETELFLSREKSLNQVKTRLVSMASHEFRSPLSRIQLSASLIQRYFQRMDQGKIMDHLRKIKSAVDDMTDTLNDFLSIERIEAGNMQPDYRPFDVRILAEELTDEIRLQAKEGAMILHRHLGEQSVVNLDRTMLRHCIANLLSNALKYSYDTVNIELETKISNRKFTVSVRDHGIGIPPSDQPKLFEAFFRAGNTTGIPGTGLGLNIVKTYVVLMSGAISCKSREGEGTTFTMKFDLAVGKDRASRSSVPYSFTESDEHHPMA